MSYPLNKHVININLYIYLNININNKNVDMLIHCLLQQ